MITYDSDRLRLTEAVVEPLMTGWRRSPSSSRRLRMLMAAHHVVLAWDGDELVGFVAAISDGDAWAYVTLLEVIEPLRRRGIGTELMRRILEHYRTMYAVDLSCDDDLVPFYERLGMQRLNGMVTRNDAALD